MEKIVQEYVNIISSNGYKIEEIFLRFLRNSSKCLDLFITQNLNNPCTKVLVQQKFSDRCPITLEWSFASSTMINAIKFRVVFAGVGHLSNAIVKISQEAIVRILTMLVNQSIQRGVFASDLKNATVISLHKGGTKTEQGLYFRDRQTNVDDIFVKNKILTVYELHLCELLKYVVKSLKGMNIDSNLNSFFEYHNEIKSTRNTYTKLLKEPSYKKPSTGIQFLSVASNLLIVFVKVDSLTKTLKI